ncbi:MAG: hypothetical protein HZC47_01285 [Methanobacterium sp.]|uniref:hypothetical protein n=1 Tax=Methanobacterium sp. TaxID=2164 RepID=UPI003D65509A|nr:hypothetical protein [Methanobacterium sp.]
MNLKTGILIISLVIGLLGVPNCIFAQEYQDTSSNTVLQSSSPAVMQLNILNPEIKGGGRGGHGSSSSSSKKAKTDSDDNSTDNSPGFIGTIVNIIIISVFGIICVLVWFFGIKK